MIDDTDPPRRDDPYTTGELVLAAAIGWTVIALIFAGAWALASVLSNLR